MGRASTASLDEQPRATRSPVQRRERLEARISSELKELLERAAALEGRSLTDFIVSSVQAAAIEAIQRHEVITLTMRDSAAFAEALANPPVPNERLRAAAQHHRALIGE